MVKSNAVLSVSVRTWRHPIGELGIMMKSNRHCLEVESGNSGARTDKRVCLREDRPSGGGGAPS